MQEFRTESKKILDLVVNSIYSTKDVFLRELISNASDALDKVALEISAGRLEADQVGELAIELDFDVAERTITVSPNGIGMDAEALERDLGTIAHSSSLEAKLSEGLQDDDVEIIGQFGVGFYSGFMVADEIVVVSRALGCDAAFEWRSDGVEGFSVSPSQRDGRGTDVVLHLRPDDASCDYGKFLSRPALEELVRRYSNYVRYPIYLRTTGLREVEPPEGSRLQEPRFEEYSQRHVLNSMVPIWAKPRAEVSQAEYDAFYAEEFQDSHRPLRTISLRARGSRKCDVLLFIPSEPSGDFYSRDYRRGLRLYSSGVLIDECNPDLIGEHFGFVRGIVDSPDLSLNLSREGIQSDPFLSDVAKQIDRRLCSELAAMRDEERDVYVEFYGNFGRIFKFAIYATLGALNEKLEDYLMFFTALRDEPVTLREYRDAMPAHQPCLFFASGDEAGRLEASPAVRYTTEKGFDVLLCSESVDEFTLLTLRSYDGVPIKNVTAEDVRLDDADERAFVEAANAENGALFSALAAALPEDVSMVSATSLLEAEPACIRSAGPVSLGMEKYFESAGDEGGVPPIRHVLELNPRHRIFEKLRGLWAVGDKDAVTRYAWVLYGQSLLAEGLKIKDVGTYAQAVYSLM